MTFLLPPDSGEKIALSITVLLAYSVFMLLIAENIPATSETVPLIGIYLTFTMGFTFLSIVFTVIVLHLHHASHYAPRVSRRVYSFLTLVVAGSVGMKNIVERFEMSQRLSAAMPKSPQAPVQNSTPASNQLVKADCLTVNSEINFRNDSLSSTCTTAAAYYCSEVKDYADLYDASVTAPCLSRFDENCDIDAVGKQMKASRKSNRSAVAISQDRNNTNNKNYSKKKKNFDNNTKNTYNNNSNNIETVTVRRTILIDNNTDLKERVETSMAQIFEEAEPMMCIINEWKLVALIVDRVLFWVFTVLTVVSSIFLLVIIPVLKNMNFITPFTQYEVTKDLD